MLVPGGEMTNLMNAFWHFSITQCHAQRVEESRFSFVFVLFQIGFQAVSAVDDRWRWLFRRLLLAIISKSLVYLISEFETCGIPRRKIEFCALKKSVVYCSVVTAVVVTIANDQAKKLVAFIYGNVC